MKTITVILLFVLSITVNGQIRSKQHNQAALAASTMLVGTAISVHFVSTPSSYYGNDHLMNLRARQRATVAVTGMATTVITYFVVKNIRHKVRRNKTFRSACKY